VAYDRQLFTNNAVCLLALPITATSTDLTVMAGYGHLFPTPGVGEYFLVTLEDQSGTHREIIKVTGRVGDTFIGLVRAQEGTTARAWDASLGNDTLVDHRVTAETMRRAMELPEPTPPLTVQKNGTTIGVEADTLNFTGDVTVTDNGTTKTIFIGGAAGGGVGSVNGTSPSSPAAATIIDPAWNISISNATYSNYQRGFKFLVTIYMPSNHKACTFEVLGNISGDIGANDEDVSWVRTSRIGHNFLGSTQITLNKTLKQLNLNWQNDEANPVEVLVSRIQHLP